ncbi:AMIN domain-containing protein [Helicobacter suis]|uniref:AMIN domain-containing protein n=1 Tax=Helicobacter suis TaxID=104628 RepID=UPI001F074D22|nr:AMIN domain-containing protein [Helicobacter suis]
MLKQLCVLLLLGALIAREDPFEPLMKSGNNMTNHLGDEIPDYFRHVKITLPTTARVLTKITLTYKDLDASMHTKTIDVNQYIDWHYPFTFSQEGAILGPKENIYHIGNFDFWAHKNKLYLRTAAKIQRSFILTKPYRLVLDIDRGEESFDKRLVVDQKYVEQIALETHDNFYRFFIILDGQYKYKIDQKTNYLVVDLY